MTTPPDDTDTLRVGDREREPAISALHDAVGGGHLDLAEFEDRSGPVYAAWTRGDLRAALADLGGCLIEVLASWSTAKTRLGDAALTADSSTRPGSSARQVNLR